MGAQMQRRAYSRVCGASTAKRPAALGYAVAGPVQRATGSPASATGQSVTGPAKLRRLPVYLRRHLLRPLFEAVGLGDQAGQGRQVVHPDRLHLFAIPLGDFLDVVDLAVEPLGKNGKDAVDPPLALRCAVGEKIAGVVDDSYLANGQHLGHHAIVRPWLGGMMADL